MLVRVFSLIKRLQYGGSAVVVQEEEYTLFRDHESVFATCTVGNEARETDMTNRLLAKINE